MKKLDTSTRKEVLAAGAAFLKILNEIDEVEAETGAAKRLLEATQSELAATQAELKDAKAELARAHEQHLKWREATAKELASGNARTDSLQETLRTLEAEVASRRQEVNSVLQGMAALGQRLKVTTT